MKLPGTAVVIGAELNGLGVVRSLARGKIPVYVVGTGARQPGLWSRHATGRIVAGFEGRAFVDELIALAKTIGGRPVLLLSDEFAVHAVSAHRDLLAPCYRFRLPPAPMVELLADKALFQQFAEKYGFAVPRSAVIDTVADLERLADLRYPAVVKPSNKRQTLSGEAVRIARAAGPREAMDAALAILAADGGAIAQEWIEGPESNIYFSLFYRGHRGSPVSLFTGRKILCFPHDVGTTAACIAAPWARRELEETTMHFADLASFDGLGSVEYKWDSVRNRFFMIEPTVGRTDWQSEIATLCGVNIPLAACRYEMGLPQLLQRRPDPSAVWRSSFRQRPPSRLLPPDARVSDGYFRWDDPGPALAYYVFERMAARLPHWGRRTVPGRRVAKQ